MLLLRTVCDGEGGKLAGCFFLLHSFFFTGLFMLYAILWLLLLAIRNFPLAIYTSYLSIDSVHSLI